jgi:hypothetical protein
MIKTQMGFGALSCRCKKITAWALAAVTSLALLGCGGGGGGGEEEVVIAPESLDNIKMNFYNAYDLTFYRGSGTRGNESGAASYMPMVSEYSYGQSSSPNAAISITVHVPRVLTNMTYNYTRTSATTGRIVITYNNWQLLPITKATAGAPTPPQEGSIFWDDAETTTYDLVFANSGGFLGDRVARVRSMLIHTSRWSAGSETTSSFSNDFDTPNVVTSSLVLGGRVPAGYDPYDIWDTENKPRPAEFVWKSLNNRIGVRILGADELIVTFVKTGSTRQFEETGNILIDRTGGIQGGSGTYEWNREGGTLATLRLKYQDYVNGLLQNVEREYKFTFTSLDGGTFTSNEAGSGNFAQSVDRPL